MIAVTETVRPDQRVFVSYIDKSREYYLAQGFGNPYRWAYHQDAPFTRLRRPLSESRVGLVSTASLGDNHSGIAPSSVPAVVYTAPSDPAPTSLYTMHRAWDKEATHTDDVDSFAPLNRLREAAGAGRIGSLSPRFYGIPIPYSQRQTNAVDAPELLRLCREDGVDAVVLVGL